MNPNLFETCAHNSKEMTARVIIALEYFYNVKQVGSAGKDAIVTTPYSMDKKWNSYEWFTLCDNGGEINVEPINHESRMRSIPSTSNKFVITAETMAWRIWCAMTGQEIDWNDNTMPGAYERAPLPICQMYY